MNYNWKRIILYYTMVPGHALRASKIALNPFCDKSLHSCKHCHWHGGNYQWRIQGGRIGRPPPFSGDSFCLFACHPGGRSGRRTVPYTQ